jgi:hypothetical protein
LPRLPTVHFIEDIGIVPRAIHNIDGMMMCKGVDPVTGYNILGINGQPAAPILSFWLVV